MAGLGRRLYSQWDKDALSKKKKKKMGRGNGACMKSCLFIFHHKFRTRYNIKYNFLDSNKYKNILRKYL